MSKAAADEFERARRLALVNGSSDLLLAVCVATELAVRSANEQTDGAGETKFGPLVNEHEVAAVFSRAFEAERLGKVSEWNAVFREIMTKYVASYNAKHKFGGS